MVSIMISVDYSKHRNGESRRAHKLLTNQLTYLLTYHYRVKQWTLDGHGKYIRQNLVFSSLAAAQISALFGKECVSHRGLVRVHPHSHKDILSQLLYSVRYIAFLSVFVV